MLQTIALKNIIYNPFNARLDYAEKPIKELAEEIKEIGFWPGSLRGRRKNGKIELCFGHRRLEALRLLGTKEIEIDIVDLDDDQMAMQALVENLQRQGLNDMEKAEGIDRVVEGFLTKGFSNQKAFDKVAALLGYAHTSYVRALAAITGYSAETKKLIRERKISGRAAIAAHNLGEGEDGKGRYGEGKGRGRGNEMIKTGAREGLSQHAIEKIGQSIRAITDEQVREKIRDQVIAGKITDPKEVQKKADSMLRTKKEKEEGPPDMMVVVAMWKHDLKDWSKEIEAMLPYKQFMNNAPTIAEEFRKEARKFISKLETLIGEDERLERTVQ